MAVTMQQNNNAYHKINNAIHIVIHHSGTHPLLLLIPPILVSLESAANGALCLGRIQWFVVNPVLLLSYPPHPTKFQSRLDTGARVGTTVVPPRVVRCLAFDWTHGHSTGTIFTNRRGRVCPHFCVILFLKLFSSFW